MTKKDFIRQYLNGRVITDPHSEFKKFQEEHKREDISYSLFYVTCKPPVKVKVETKSYTTVRPFMLDGKLENRDCTIRATAFVCGVTYTEAKTFIEREYPNKQKNKGFPMIDLFHKLQNEKKPFLNKRIFQIISYPNLSLNQFAKKHRLGRYIVLVTGHALCLDKGIIYDSVRTGKKCKVLNAIELV